MTLYNRPGTTYDSALYDYDGDFIGAPVAGSIDADFLPEGNVDRPGATYFHSVAVSIEHHSVEASVE